MRIVCFLNRPREFHNSAHHARSVNEQFHAPAISVLFAHSQT